VITRQNSTKACFIARTLVRERFQATKFPIPGAFFKQLPQLRNIKDIRLVEAHQSKIY
jgi:hypothetical protein